MDHPVTLCVNIDENCVSVRGLFASREKGLVFSSIPSMQCTDLAMAECMPIM
jgi:hypothetical protein